MSMQDNGKVAGHGGIQQLLVQPFRNPGRNCTGSHENENPDHGRNRFQQYWNNLHRHRMLWISALCPVQTEVENSPNDQNDADQPDQGEGSTFWSVHEIRDCRCWEVLTR